MEDGFDFEEGFIVRVELRAVFDLAKGGLKDGETMPGFQHVNEILGFNAVHWSGNLVSIEPRFRAIVAAIFVTSVTRVMAKRAIQKSAWYDQDCESRYNPVPNGRNMARAG